MADIFVMATLFVVAAHAPDDYNRELLADTLRSIEEHHNGAPILVVDNGSPEGSVMTLIASLAICAMQISSRSVNVCG